jgi:TM2 domain-containing membrane protein YozV
MSGGAFGRKGSIDGAALAARRAAFLAEERARSQRPAQDGVRPPPASTHALVREKSVATAYLLWFFLGGLSAHRFYLGFSTSGAIQVTLLPISWALIASGSLAAFVTMAAGSIWILVDAFLIPGLQREANARLRRNASASVFA